jgi:D-alanyl-D-alanine carboxypeptidase (penicillin-binding protein 5/6)
MTQRVKMKKSGVRKLVTFLLMVVAAVFIYKFIITLRSDQIFGETYDDRKTPLTSLIEPDLIVPISSDELNSPYAILIRLSDNTVLLQKNSREKVYPASLTKMMTVLVAIENLPDLNEKIEFPRAIFDELYKANASMAGFQPGEQVRVIDVLYGAMLPSGAECCIALARRIAGSEKNFVRLMNQKAEELGMENTHFQNSTGLHNKNHYTTAEELAILLTNALENDTFRKIFTTFRYSMPPTNKHSGGITFYSTMYEKLGDQNIIDGEILGGKTGYTSQAGLCLASLAKVGEQEYILITTGAKGDHNSEQYNITDALSVYNGMIK